MIVITTKEIYSDSGKYIHRIGTDAYFKRCSKLPTDTADNFEEVDSIPETVPEDEGFKAETEEKVKAMFFARNISTQINGYGLSNKEALYVKDLFPEWKEDVGKINKGDRYNCDESLWECVQEHESQANWRPSLNTASLWKVVDKDHEGTLEDPIPYTPPMEIFKDKHYIQDGVTYKCIRDSEILLSHDLRSLVGTYVESVL